MARKNTDDPEPSLRHVLAWAAVTLTMAITAGGTGYFVAAATDDAAAGPTLESASPGQPRLLRASDIYSLGRRDGARGARPRAFARGRARGRLEAAREFRPGEPAHRRIFEAGRRAGHGKALAALGFAGDGFYVVAVRRHGRRIELTHGPLRPRAAYRLCRRARAVCVGSENRGQRAGGLASP